MLFDMTRTRSGNMSPELQAGVDRLIEEFMAAVNAITDDRHLQRGIARSQLPSSMVHPGQREALHPGPNPFREQVRKLFL